MIPKSSKTIWARSMQAIALTAVVLRAKSASHSNSSSASSTTTSTGGWPSGSRAGVTTGATAASGAIGSARRLGDRDHPLQGGARVGGHLAALVRAEALARAGQLVDHVADLDAVDVRRAPLGQQVDEGHEVGRVVARHRGAAAAHGVVLGCGDVGQVDDGDAAPRGLLAG